MRKENEVECREGGLEMVGGAFVWSVPQDSRDSRSPPS